MCAGNTWTNDHYSDDRALVAGVPIKDILPPTIPALSNALNKTPCKRREENQLDATEFFIALIIFSTCFGQFYAHHQELETILVLLPQYGV